MPFEAFDALSARAFGDHERAYNATAPVFYRVVPKITLPNLGPAGDSGNNIEIKLPAYNWALLNGLGLPFLVALHDRVIDPAWAALLLAAPASPA